MSLTDVQNLTADCMDKIVKCFKSGAKITVLVRAPGFPDRDFVMTDDDPAEAIEMLKRRQASGPDNSDKGAENGR